MTSPSTLPSHAVGETTPALLEETIGASFDRTVRRFGGSDALVDRAANRRFTYTELACEVDAVALGLVALGVAKGDRVAIWSPNRWEWVVVHIAAAKLGAILVTVNPAYRAHELGYVLRQSGTSVLFAVSRFKDSHYAAMIDTVRAECPQLREVFFFGEASFARLVDTGREANPARLVAIAAALSPHDPINIQYTSGTTGFPKGACLSHRNILNNGYVVGALIGLGETDRLCLPVPFYHCFGMVMGTLAAIAHGSAIVIAAPSFDPAATLASIATERCSALYGVPTMFIAMLGDPSFATHDLSSLRTGIMAGSPCPIEVMKDVIGRMGMRDVSICYGMTETSPVSTQTRLTDSLERRVGTVGRVHPHVEVKIVDAVSGATVPRGSQGELFTRGYSVMLGYWEDPEKTSKSIDDEGFMHTGDLAVMDDEGYVNITGRIKDMVIRGGENIYPREIEEFLYTHPDILDVQVIGVPDAKFGEELMAWIRLRPRAASIDSVSLRAFCAGRLAHYKIPRYVHVVDEFPMTVTGKVRKVAMREMAIAILGLEVEAKTPHA